MRGTRSAFDKVGRFVTPADNVARVVPCLAGRISPYDNDFSMHPAPPPAVISVLVHLSSPHDAYPLVSHLESVGVQVLACLYDRSKLVQEVIRHAPDAVIFEDSAPDDSLFDVLQRLADTAPCPVVVFTSDGSVEQITRASEVGVHAYVVNGYGQPRLRSLIHLAMARFRREQALRADLQAMATRFEERKMVDRAKGILMRARQVSDDDAFQILRTASMHSNQRLGQVSQHIIHSARFAEDVNRSGQLRMLSQRLVKLALLQGLGGQAALAGGAQDRLRASVLRVDAILAGLGKSLSQPTFGDLLGQVAQTWAQLKPVLQAAPGPDRATLVALEKLDRLAEQLLAESERLTVSLEQAGAVLPLQVLNLAGRQRMLSQRFAKYALLGLVDDRAGGLSHQADMDQARLEFEEALAYLTSIPLTSREIRLALEAAALSWSALLAGASPTVRAGRTARIESLASASEELLDLFEQLSAHYERSMQMLVG